ncbi:MAG: serine/threonine-protein kinase [Gemmataceae bacterium]
MPAPTADTILAALRRVPLLSASQLRRVEEAASRGHHPAERVVGRLVEKGWATKFQADALLADKADTLVVGPYLLVDLLGEGGMGRVYKARHVRLGRVDAVKVIRADKLASRTLARRFAREIRLTACLEHPHVVRALDAGEVGGRLYLATEFIDGQDLGSTVLHDGPLTPADACLVAYQACQALQYVHECGLVHRDVKPSNLMRERATRVVKLMDLGLSGVRAGDAATSMAGGLLTTDGVMLGTPDFMPPEQARNPHGADIRADLYGLGATLFFLLSGRPPYAGSAVEKLMAHASQPVPPVVTPGGPAPPPLAALVTKLMAKNPDDRYPTPAAVAEALLGLRAGARADVVAPAAAQAAGPVEPSDVLPAEAWQSEFEQLVDEAESQAKARVRPPRTYRPTRWRWVLPAAAVTLGLGVLVASGVLGRNPSPPVEQPPPPPTPAEELRDLRARSRRPRTATPSAAASWTSGRSTPRPRTRSPPPDCCGSCRRRRTGFNRRGRRSSRRRAPGGPWPRSRSPPTTRASSSPAPAGRPRN